MKWEGGGTKAAFVVLNAGNRGVDVADEGAAIDCGGGWLREGGGEAVA